ncbi:CLUMA_CG004307, isoform A [Clunio marinus]|uniref:CLUMA_CG004307, isoform A n=1 Tax=Clunio marinus TaxID=568069 RepID=A0A1J1HRF6_9DIPT|nr:CLUMA_CG004307, isoform A [Clunio marinus]
MKKNLYRFSLLLINSFWTKNWIQLGNELRKTKRRSKEFERKNSNVMSRTMLKFHLYKIPNFD